MTRPRRWLTALSLVLCMGAATGAWCDERRPDEQRVVPPDSDSLVRAILGGGDGQLRNAALWLRAMTPEESTAALKRLQETVRLELLMARADEREAVGRVHGAVRDAGGRAVSARIRLKETHPCLVPGGVRRAVLRNLTQESQIAQQSGTSFDFGGLRAGYYSLRAEIGGLEYVVPTLRVADTAVRRDIVLGSAAIELAVVDRLGAPIPGASVLARLRGAMWLEAVADAHGKVRLERLPAGTWTVSAGGGDALASGEVRVRVQAGGSEPLRLIALTQTILELHIVDPQGKDVAGVAVRFRSTRGAKHVEVGGTTNARGRIRSSLTEGGWGVDVADGKLTLQVELRGEVEKIQTVVLR